MMAREVIYNPKRWLERALNRARSITPKSVPPSVVHLGRDWFGGFSYANYHNYTILLLEELAQKDTLTPNDEMDAIIAATRLEGTCEECRQRETAKRNIAKALRRARYGEMVKRGGARPGPHPGRPPKEASQDG